MPKISVITPVYCDNVEKTNWLLETIQSVQSQSFIDWEMILVNDKSPIDLGEARYKWNDDKRIRWFDLVENGGPAKARNLAVELSESACILPLDADDMLALPTTLEQMYEIWLLDQMKIIYGSIQHYIVNASNQFYRKPEVFNLPDYNFSNTRLMLTGAMPVTAMHSKECFYTVGGWKSVFSYGLEDVEYWYAAGLAGYCGLRINEPTLLYRKHDNSRTETLKSERQFQAMQRKIIDMHSDPLKKGIFPMSCCGGSKNNQPSNPQINVTQSAAKGMILPLEGYPDSELEWVAYNGPRKGRFNILAGDISYTIFGTGQLFQIHKSHRNIFAQRQRLGFAMNQSDPREREVEIEPEAETPIEAPQSFSASNSPELPIVERLDSIAAQTRQVQIVEVEAIIEPNPPSEMSDVMPAYSLVDLEMSDNITQILSIHNWTVAKIANAKPGQLTGLPNIGLKRAESLIEKANTLLNQ